MNFSLIKVIILWFIIAVSFVEYGCSIKFLNDLLETIKKQVKKRVPTKNNAFDDSIVYAVPSPDGYGFILHGYGKPYDPYAYDNDVDIHQIPKMWSGHISIPNFFKAPHDEYGLFGGHERIVKGSDNRLGFRVAVPYLGDFQYLREIGPGRFTDNLGPGKFDYPGFKAKTHKYETHDGYGHYSSYGSSYGHSESYAGSHEVGYEGIDHNFSSSENSEVYVSDEVTSKSSAEEEEPDPFEGLRNYPWHKRK